jgi:hypothetical protein
MTIKLPTIEEWAVALESEVYKQGTGVLKGGDEFCCLGVHAVLAGVPSRTGSEYKCVFDFPEWGDTYCLNPLMDAYGMDHNGLPRDVTDVNDSLTNKNDAGATFTEIAAILREWRDQGLIHDPVSPVDL